MEGSITDQDVIGNLMSREVIYHLLREEFAREPRDEEGIKLCNEQIERIGKQIYDVIINGTGDRDKTPVGIINFSWPRRK